jgi:HAD superfamily hydrolase (TIGR01509 family)
MNRPSAIFFDMDGILIDSEPIWIEVEQNILSSYGVLYSEAEARFTKGFRIDEAVNFWFRRYPWKEIKTVEEVSNEIIDGVIALIRQRGIALKGVYKTLQMIKNMGIPLALVSSSSKKIIETVVDQLQLQGIFDFLYSAEQESFGKPHPAVYISSAKKFGVEPEECVVFEDSLNGVIAAKAAKMKCIAVPDLKDQEKKEFFVADVILNSLDEFDQDIFTQIV